MLQLAQNQAATIIVGPVLDTSGLPYNGALTRAMFKIQVQGASSPAALDAGGAAPVNYAQGLYQLTLTANDTATDGYAEIMLATSDYAMQTKDLLIGRIPSVALAEKYTVTAYDPSAAQGPTLTATGFSATQFPDVGLGMSVIVLRELTNENQAFAAQIIYSDGDTLVLSRPLPWSSWDALHCFVFPGNAMGDIATIEGADASTAIAAAVSAPQPPGSGTKVCFRYPNVQGSPPVPTALANPEFAVFRGVQVWHHGQGFIDPGSDYYFNTDCFSALTPVIGPNGFTGDYTADLPAGIDPTGTYTIRMYDNASTPTPGSELPPVQVWPGTPVTVTQVSVSTEDTIIRSN